MHRYLMKTLHSLALVAYALALAACTSSPQTHFVPPEQRPASPFGQPWPRNHVLVLAYHDVQDNDADQTFITVRTPHLVQHLAWLRENGYQAVSVDQILQARNGGPDLPEKAVLLTFDDGYTSFSTRVLPLLQAYRWPAVLAVVGAWADGPPGKPIDFGGKQVTRDHFLEWAAIREIAESGLVELASHSDNLHYGVPANPQGNTQPAAATRVYNALTGTYETDDAYALRIRNDAASISRKLQRISGRRPRVWVWPYGEANGQAIKELRNQGYQLIMTLDWGLADIAHADNMPRLLVSDDPDAATFAATALSMEEQGQLRTVQISLDDIYDPDQAATDRNLGALVQRIADLKINTVFLQADADENGDGLADAVYFPNRTLTMKADLFNRVAWQLRTRAGVRVYASLSRSSNITSSEQIMLHEDMARYTNFIGVLLDDTLPEPLTQKLAQRVRELRGPQVSIALRHVVSARADDMQHTRTALDQFMQRAMHSYDHAVIVLPSTGAGSDKAGTNVLIDSTVSLVSRYPDVLAHTVFTLQPTQSDASNPQPFSADDSIDLARDLLRLQRLGAVNVGYAGDDYINDQPRLQRIRPVLSTAWYPYK